LGDEGASQRVHKISINYLEFGESYDWKTTIVDIYFSTMIAEILKNDPDPKTMAECKSAWTGINRRMQSKQKYPRSLKGRYSLK
jgi:hypothetical protein